MYFPKESETPQPTDWAAVFHFFGGVSAAVTFVVVAWVFGIYYPDSVPKPPDTNLDARGNVIGALFSGLAFVGVVAAIILQWRELGLQRQELRETKQAMRDSATAQQAQTTKLQEQTDEMRSQVEVAKETAAIDQFFQLVRYLDERREDRRAIFLLMEKNLAYDRWNPENKAIGEKYARVSI